MSSANVIAGIQDGSIANGTGLSPVPMVIVAIIPALERSVWVVLYMLHVQLVDAPAKENVPCIFALFPVDTPLEFTELDAATV